MDRTPTNSKTYRFASLFRETRQSAASFSPRDLDIKWSTESLDTDASLSTGRDYIYRPTVKASCHPSRKNHLCTHLCSRRLSLVAMEGVVGGEVSAGVSNGHRRRGATRRS